MTQPTCFNAPRRRFSSPDLCLVATLPLFFSACMITTSPAPPAAINAGSSDSLIHATLYANTAAEYEAATHGVYASAGAQLDELLRNAGHTAALEQSGEFRSLPPAIILDVDETVLDNSPFEVRLIEDGTSYPTGWSEWCNESAARPILGALDFLHDAAGKGVTIFYVTNRKEPVKAGTHANLVEHGFPMTEGVDTLMMRDGRPEWNSDKTSRRAAIAKNYRVVMLFGDNAGDFIGLDGAKGTAAERSRALGAHGDKWGRSWFMLPNPMYGYWDESAIDGNYQQPTAELNRLRVRAMDAKR